MEEAIKNDDILWHANPVNWLTEVADDASTLGVQRVHEEAQVSVFHMEVGNVVSTRVA